MIKTNRYSFWLTLPQMPSLYYSLFKEYCQFLDYFRIRYYLTLRKGKTMEELTQWQFVEVMGLYVGTVALSMVASTLKSPHKPKVN
jgi:hypothetical protein